MSDEELIAMARAARVDDRLSDGALYGRLADRLCELIADRDSCRREIINAYEKLNAADDYLNEAHGMIDEVVGLLRDARQAMHDVVTGDYPNPRDHRPGQCRHGRDYWEDCGSCVDEWLQAAVDRIDTFLQKAAPLSAGAASSAENA